jgi:hypothetical protein
VFNDFVKNYLRPVFKRVVPPPAPMDGRQWVEVDEIIKKDK